MVFSFKIHFVLHKNNEFRVPIWGSFYGGRAEWFPAEQEGISSSVKRDFGFIFNAIIGLPGMRI
jgi:hypothetical protein